MDSLKKTVLCLFVFAASAVAASSSPSASGSAKDPGAEFIVVSEIRLPGGLDSATGLILDSCRESGNAAAGILAVAQFEKTVARIVGMPDRKRPVAAAAFVEKQGSSKVDGVAFFPRNEKDAAEFAAALSGPDAPKERPRFAVPVKTEKYGLYGAYSEREFPEDFLRGVLQRILSSPDTGALATVHISGEAGKALSKNLAEEASAAASLLCRHVWEQDSEMETKDPFAILRLEAGYAAAVGRREKSIAFAKRASELAKGFAEAAIEIFRTQSGVEIRCRASAEKGSELDRVLAAADFGFDAGNPFAFINPGKDTLAFAAYPAGGTIAKMAGLPDPDDGEPAFLAESASPELARNPKISKEFGLYIAGYFLKRPASKDPGWDEKAAECGLALYNGILRSPQGIRGWRIDAAKSGGGTVLSTTSKYHSPDMAAELAKDGVWMEKGAALANLGAPSSAVFEARKGSSVLLEFDLRKAGNALADHFAKAASVFAGNGKWAMAEYAAGNGYMANTWGDSALVRGAMENRAEPPSVPPAFPAFGAGARMCAYYHADAGRFFAAATANIPGAGKNRSFSEGASSGAAWIASDGFHAFMRMDFGAAKCFMQARDVFAPGLFEQPMPPPSALLQPEEDDID